MNIIYEGFFVANTLLTSLEKNIWYKHITTEFRPKITHEYLYGTEAIFEVTGYGNDGNNEGYSVKLIETDSEELKDIYNNIEVPHITLSVSANGKPVNTAKLNFNPINASSVRLIIRTTFGGFNGKDVILDKEKIA